LNGSIENCRLHIQRNLIRRQSGDRGFRREVRKHTLIVRKYEPPNEPCRRRICRENTCESRDCLSLTYILE
jgi:hypothetical protein